MYTACAVLYPHALPWLFFTSPAALRPGWGLIKPPFIMFYLTFTLERAREVLERHGFELDVREPFAGGEYASLRLVVARRL